MTAPQPGGRACRATRVGRGDNPNDAPNANWTNVNYTTYSNARVTNQTGASAVYEMDYQGGAGQANQIRAVLTPEANIALCSISHIVY